METEIDFFNLPTETYNAAELAQEIERLAELGHTDESIAVIAEVSFNMGWI